VDLLLCGQEHVRPVASALVAPSHAAVSVGHLYTVRACDGATADTSSRRTVGGYGGAGAAARSVVEVLDLGDNAAVGLDGGEVHLLVLDSALLPRHGGAVLKPSPNLVSVVVDLPVGDAVVLCDVLADRDLLDVSLLELLLLTVTHVEVLVSSLAGSRATEVLLDLAVGVSVDVADHLGDVDADLLLFLLAAELVVVVSAALGLGGGVLDVVEEGHIAAVSALDGGSSRGYEDKGEAEDG